MQDRTLESNYFPTQRICCFCLLSLHVSTDKWRWKEKIYFTSSFYPQKLHITSFNRVVYFDSATVYQFLCFFFFASETLFLSIFLLPKVHTLEVSLVTVSFLSFCLSDSVCILATSLWADVCWKLDSTSTVFFSYHISLSPLFHYYCWESFLSFLKLDDPSYLLPL